MNPESLQAIALSLAEERSVATVLQRIVLGVGSQSGVALARVWLLAPGDICSVCLMRPECPDQARCLHLAASHGRPGKAADNWDRLDGAFRRFPMGIRKVGRVAASGQAILIKDVSTDMHEFARHEWIREERIVSFGCQPLVFRGEVLGVLAIFNREACDEASFAWLRTFADYAAVALANSRAFAEIERLREQLELENAYLREEVREAMPAAGRLVGDSAPLRHVLQQIELVAPTSASVLILGESGTGKELVAREIHDRSARSRRAMIRVNCASIPHELFESEFFGHVKGAFTGALRDRAGRFQAADSGTLFLDEVGEIPLDLQGKLLRAIQEGQFERVGDDTARSVDVRLLAATNRDLAAEVKAGRFREDLYYRLSVFPIHVPPLRDRAVDIPLLASHFAELASQRLKVPRPRLARADIDRLVAYDWPGNIRELQNVIDRAAIVSRGGPLRLSDLLPRPHESRRATAVPLALAIQSETAFKEQMRTNLQRALEESGGRVYGPDGAARRLGIKPTTLMSRIKVLGIRRNRD
jgi:transcriptional regulator with GAF, ATPase, and Fis domain